MYKTLIFFAVLATALTAGDVLPAGKCNTYNIKPIPLDYDKLSRSGRWYVAYAPDSETHRSLDSVYIDVSLNNDESYRVHVHRTKKDKSKSSQVFKQRYIDNVIAEVSGHGTGHYTHHHNYPLAMTKENAILIYRCADSGNPQVDSRYIIAPVGSTLSESGLRQLLEADKKYNFRGGLYKLPNALPTD